VVLSCCRDFCNQSLFILFDFLAHFLVIVLNFDIVFSFVYVVGSPLPLDFLFLCNHVKIGLEKKKLKES
jgi:hypothetical protein